MTASSALITAIAAHVDALPPDVAERVLTDQVGLAFAHPEGAVMNPEALEWIQGWLQSRARAREVEATLARFRGRMRFVGDANAPIEDWDSAE